MLIARPSGDGFAVIDGYSRAVRLGEGLAASGRLADAAMDRTIDALKVCTEKIAARGAGRVRAVATAACRDAANGDAFIDRVAKETGLKLDAIDADAEAALTLAGCTPLLRTGHPKGLMFDIGGGSTEFLWIEVPTRGAPQVIDMVSLPWGVVTLAETYGDGDGNAAQDRYAEIVAAIDAQLAPFDAANAIGPAIAENQVQMLGTSGTMTTLGALHLGLRTYDRSRIDGLSMDLAHVRAHAARLSVMDCQERRRLPCVGDGRADLMLMGCAVLTAVTRRWPVPSIRIADRGIREGLILGMIEADRNPPPAPEPPAT